MIDKIIKFLFSHPQITFEMLCTGLNVESNEIKEDFLSLLRDGYLHKSRRNELLPGGKQVSVQIFSLRPKGTEYYHNFIHESIISKKNGSEDIMDTIAKKIFISHSYNAKGIAERIIDRLILPNYIINKDQDIFFTSARKTGIRSSLNWHNKIKSSLIECKIFIAIITTDFKKSEMCLGEIGAAWVLDKSIHPLIVPPIKFNKFNSVISELQAEDLCKKDSIISFIDSIGKDLSHFYGIQKKSNHLSESNVDTFYNYIRRKNTKKRKTPHFK